MLTTVFCTKIFKQFLLGLLLDGVANLSVNQVAEALFHNFSIACATQDVGENLQFLFQVEVVFAAEDALKGLEVAA